MLDHLAIDRADRRVDLIAVGNWRVIGADSARLLARRGAQLVHSAPSTGVRDWSDLRIAVSAGVWLGSGRPGDLIEIISDDRAFDAVGDVAAVLGVEYRRLSYRGLTGLAPSARRRPRPRRRRPARVGAAGAADAVGAGAAAAAGAASIRAGAGRCRRASSAASPPPPARAAEPARAQAEPDAHTAPHDELVEVVRELADHAPNGAVLIDTLARALKERGFSRPPGSPRLITRLRRIRQLVVSQTGRITLADAAGAAPVPDRRGPDGGRRARAGRDGARRRGRRGDAGQRGPAPGLHGDARRPAPVPPAPPPARGAWTGPRRRRGWRRRRAGARPGLSA